MLYAPLPQSGSSARHLGKPLHPRPLAASTAVVVDLGQIGRIGAINRLIGEELAKRAPSRLPIVDRM